MSVLFESCHGVRGGVCPTRRISLLALAIAWVASLLLGVAPALAVTQKAQWTVTAVSQPTNFAPEADETQAISIDASGGAFQLTFAEEATAPIPYNASAAMVESALNSLTAIGGVGASVTVTGGPGGNNPYVVTFGGAFQGVNVEQIGIETGGLTVSVGGTLSCTGAPTEVGGFHAVVSYQWLRNGQPIAGATSATYTTVAGDAGDALQCEVDVAKTQGIPASTAASQVAVVAPAPATQVPQAPEVIAEPEPIKEEAEPGHIQTCNPGAWTGNPTFAYQWLKDGASIAGATEETYEVKPEDVPGNIQCEVIGTNAGGSVVGVSANKETYPKLNAEMPPQATATLSFATVSTTTEGGSPGGVYLVYVQNTGGASTDGSTVTIADTLPAGLVQSRPVSGRDLLSGKFLSCAATTCTYTGVVAPGDYLRLAVPVTVQAGAPSQVTNLVTVTGGGATNGLVEVPTQISAAPPSFGFAPGSLATVLSSTQAGAHPDLTVSYALNTLANGLLAGAEKSIVSDLPPGFVGDLADTERCPITAFAKMSVLFEPQPCALGTQVGVVTLHINFNSTSYLLPFANVVVPVYNLSTNPGEIAKLGFQAVAFGVQGTVSLRPGDYGVRTTFEDINERDAQVTGASLTIWGVPADRSHDLMRGLVCNGLGCTYANGTEAFLRLTKGQQSTSSQIPYLTAPTDCTGAPLQATLSATSWQHPDERVSVTSPIGPLTGCNLLEFGPEITASPDTTHGDSPAGFTFEVKMAQEGLVSPQVPSPADIESTTATLPLGVAINPGQAAGLGACQLSVRQIEESSGPPACPSDSRVGQVQVRTPVLKNKLEGNVYVLQSNPPNLKLLVAPEDPADGIYVKFVGNVHLDEATGQLVTTFEHTPQLPFDDLKLLFSGGAQAALTTPVRCGTYTTNADFAPWSGEPDALAQSTFPVESGPDGSACSSSLPFNPSLTAGATTDQAGGFTNFSMLLTRPDGQQRVSRLQFKTPPGLLGMLSKVQLCGAAEAAADACPEGSQIGHTVVEAGPGPYPLVVPQPGSPPAPIYLTGAYKGAPYGLLIKVPLQVGPFDLGTEVVRARIEVDPVTSQLTITTDPLPQIIKGVPTDLRTINAVIDRAQFMFNPTSCAPMAFAGTATSDEGASAPISSRFQVGSCKDLAFKPGFRASTSGKTSRVDGASLHVKLTYPKAPFGTQANIRSVKVELPKQLPSRLPTLQQACTEATFDANPSACPAASRVGVAVAHTPILPVPLTGPAYFVSHGGARFPELIVVLQGYGITVDLHGETFIDKRTGITSSTFGSVPDVPVERFELTLPEGPYSALAAPGGKLCVSDLKMPTIFTAQNGTVRRQTTHIAVTGCKPALSVLRHAAKGQKVTLVVHVPSAGRLRASGHGLSRAVEKLGKAGDATLTLSLTKAERRLLAKHPGRRLKVRVKLTFTPIRGKRIVASVSTLVG